MDLAKGRAVAGLYDDVMGEILSRVPVKDLRRSTCVFKPWRHLIVDPLHRKKLPQTLEGFFHGGPDGPHHSYGYFTSLSGRGQSVPPVDPSFSFLAAKLPGVKRMVLLDSCNGLLLFGCSREDRFGYIVCNPATEEFVTVPVSSGSCPPPPAMEGSDDEDDGERYAHTFLMFDPAVSLRYHLVQIWENTSMEEVEAVHSYSSERRAWSDRSSKWRRGEKDGEWGMWGKSSIEFTLGRALVNGLLHFIVYHVQQEKALIVAVDGDRKTCRIISWPDKHESEDAILIGQSQGHLHLISVKLLSDSEGRGFFFTHFSVWVLEDYDTQEWILKHKVRSLELIGFLHWPIKHIDIVAIHPDHNSIIFVHTWNHELVSHDMNSKEQRSLGTLGLGDDYWFITPYVPCFMESLFLATKD